MNFKKIYEYRFQQVDHSKKKIVWKELSNWLFYKYLNLPEKILDPAGGMCEFINAVPASEKWTIDVEEDFIMKFANKDVKVIIGSSLEVKIPDNYFDGIFVSNFLEHLMSQEEVATFLKRMFDSIKKNGRIVVMGPNFKYCFKEYFDFADHNVILSELGLAEHLYGAGFEIVKIIPRFFPLSFRSGGRVPVTPLVIKLYLHFPFVWNFIGRQFLLVAEKK